MAAADSSDLANGLSPDDDLMMTEVPERPFDWVREGSSFWLFEENGEFAIPRIGVEAEPWTWENRRYASNLTFADGRVLTAHGVGPMPSVFDGQGRPTVMGGGPLTFRCIEPFRRWHIAFDGEMTDTTLANQMARTTDGAPNARLRYEAELTMTVPADIQDISPENFAGWSKGRQRDAVSVGLGLRFTQLFDAVGELTIDGATRTFRGTGNRVKRRSVRTDGLMLRGHIWQGAVFPDGRAFGFEIRPVHDDGEEPWNEGFVYVDGQMHHARARNVHWLKDIVPSGDDVSFELESDLGIAKISGSTVLSTFRVSNPDLWGMNLHQGGAVYEWDGQRAFGMIERSNVTGKRPA